MTNKIHAWILVDEKIGSNNQALALGEALGIDCSTIDLAYNNLAKLPSILLPKNFSQLASPDLNSLLLQNTPNLVISASRKSALVSAAIKYKNPDIKTIHILNPNISFSNFDLVILPQHDKNINNKYNNILKIIGALNNVKQKIEAEPRILENQYANFIKKEFATILIGGNTKNFTFSKNSVEAFYKMILQIAVNNDLKYFITFSRRTPQIVKDVFMEFKNSGHQIYDPLASEFNPYPYIIAKSKFVISTCDSISMLSEIASTGKPLYIYIPEGFKSTKHLAFLYQLSDLGIAQILDRTVSFLQEYNYTHLNETRKAAEYVLSSILSVK